MYLYIVSRIVWILKRSWDERGNVIPSWYSWTQVISQCWRAVLWWFEAHILFSTNWSIHLDQSFLNSDKSRYSFFNIFFFRGKECIFPFAYWFKWASHIEKANCLPKRILQGVEDCFHQQILRHEIPFWKHIFFYIILTTNGKQIIKLAQKSKIWFTTHAFEWKQFAVIAFSKWSIHENLGC